MLQLGQLIREMDYIHPGNKHVTTGSNSLGIYSVAETTVREFASKMCRMTEGFGSNGVTVMGSPEAKVTTVALGVGCHIPTFEALGEGTDLLIMVYDRADQQLTRIPLVEEGANLIVTEHSIAEIPAMSEMCIYLEKQFPQLEVCFYNHEPRSYVYSAQSPELSWN